MKVLIIEKDEVAQKQLTEILTKAVGNIIIKHAYSFNEAQALFSLFKPDKVLLSITLYDGNTLILVQMFKLLNPKVKIIILVNKPTMQFRKRCLEFGVDDFFEHSNIDSLKLFCSDSEATDFKSY